MINDVHDLLIKVSNEIKNILNNEILLTFSSGRYLEINNIGVSKGSALEWLVKYLNIDIKNTIAIGDNNNDNSMIEKAGLGICVKNGVEQTKKISKYVTEKNFDEGSLKEVLEKFILNE